VEVQSPHDGDAEISAASVATGTVLLIDDDVRAREVLTAS
jgi:hypothetical protein